MTAFAAATLASCARAEPVCRKETFEAARYAVCEVAQGADIRLFLNDSAGAPFGEFDALKTAVEGKGEALLFAMNAGMYRQDRSPVGLYVENGAEARKLSTKDGPGNFHLKPNGVFVIDGDGAAHVMDTENYQNRFPSGRSDDAAARPRYATQSGPMLVIDGVLHPKFSPDSESKKYRNGVGVHDGKTAAEGRVIFVISDTPVTFEAFARFFRDELKAENALYLDGTISRLYAPELKRNDDGARMGPIVGVIRKAE